MALEAEAKTALKSFKTHWVAFLVVAILLVALAFNYERNNPGSITGKLAPLAKLPIVGSWFGPKPAGA